MQENNYIVGITANNSTMNIRVKALNKKKAKEMVQDVLIRCNLFGFNSLKEFKLTCLKVNERNT